MARGSLTVAQCGVLRTGSYMRQVTFGAGAFCRFGAHNALLARVPALLAAWQPGEEGGNAVADLLLGVASPSGRLSMAWPSSVGSLPGGMHGGYWAKPYQGHDFYNYVETHASAASFDGPDPRPGADRWNFGGTLFPFGYGLHYAEAAVSYGPLRVLASNGTGTFVAVDVVRAAATAAATAATAGGSGGGFEGPVAVTVMVFQQKLVSAFVRDELALAGSAKVWSGAPGSTVTAEVVLPRANFAFYNVSAAAWAVEPGTYRLYHGVHAADLRSNVTVEL